MQKWLVALALCFVAIFGATDPSYANALKVVFRARCDNQTSKALVQFETGYRDGNQVPIGFVMIVDGATGSAELSGFPSEEFRNVTGTVRALAPSSLKSPFVVTVKATAKDGVVHTAEAVVAIPLNNTAVAISVTPDQLSPKLPADAKLKDITFHFKNPERALGQFRITGMGINSQLVSLNMDAPLAVCP